MEIKTEKLFEWWRAAYSKSISCCFHLRIGRYDNWIPKSLKISRKLRSFISLVRSMGFHIGSLRHTWRTVSVLFIDCDPNLPPIEGKMIYSVDKVTFSGAHFHFITPMNLNYAFECYAENVWDDTDFFFASASFFCSPFITKVAMATTQRRHLFYEFCLNNNILFFFSFQQNKNNEDKNEIDSWKWWNFENPYTSIRLAVLKMVGLMLIGFTTVAFSTENVAAKHLFSRASIINIKSW